jgi:hypothetical protein
VLIQAEIKTEHTAGDETRSQFLSTLSSTYHYKVSHHSIKGKVIEYNILKSKFSLVNTNLSRLCIRRQSHGGQKSPLEEYKIFHLKRGVGAQQMTTSISFSTS